MGYFKDLFTDIKYPEVPYLTDDVQINPAYTAAMDSFHQASDRQLRQQKFVIGSAIAAVIVVPAMAITFGIQEYHESTLPHRNSEGPAVVTQTVLKSLDNCSVVGSKDGYEQALTGVLARTPLKHIQTLAANNATVCLTDGLAYPSVSTTGDKNVVSYIYSGHSDGPVVSLFDPRQLPEVSRSGPNDTAGRVLGAVAEGFNTNALGSDGTFSVTREIYWGQSVVSRFGPLGGGPTEFYTLSSPLFSSSIPAEFAKPPLKDSAAETRPSTGAEDHAPVM